MYSGLPTPIVPNATWAAVEGWDPVTGMLSRGVDNLHSNMWTGYGTPIFPKLVRLIGGGGDY